MLGDWDIEPDIVPSSTALVKTELTAIATYLKAGSDGVDIPNEVYHSLEGISGSNLKLLAESNKHLDNKKLFDLGESDALTFGTLFHTLVLEPQNVHSEYVVSPKFDGRTNQGKYDKKQFEEDNKDKIVIDKDVFEKAEKMTINVRAICGDIIEAGIKERSYFVRDDDLLLKIRPDVYCHKTGNEWDLKSFTHRNMDMSDRALEQTILSLGYHVSAGFRNHVRKILGMPTGEFNLMFVSTSPGHIVRNIKIADAWIEESEFYVKELLDGRKFYLGTGVDPSLMPVIDRSSRKFD